MSPSRISSVITDPHLYLSNIQSVSRNIEFCYDLHKIFNILLLDPLPLTALDVITSQPNSLTWRFAWHERTRFDQIFFQIAREDNPEAILDTAEVRLPSTRCRIVSPTTLIFQRRIVNGAIDNSVNFEGLDPSTNYIVTAVVRHGDLESKAITRTARTGKIMLFLLL